MYIIFTGIHKRTDFPIYFKKGLKLRVSKSLKVSGLTSFSTNPTSFSHFSHETDIIISLHMFLYWAKIFFRLKANKKDFKHKFH